MIGQDIWSQCTFQDIRLNHSHDGGIIERLDACASKIVLFGEKFLICDDSRSDQITEIDPYVRTYF